jgi:hypothetical protein
VSSHEVGQNISQENEPRPKIYVRVKIESSLKPSFIQGNLSKSHFKKTNQN